MTNTSPPLTYKVPLSLSAHAIAQKHVQNLERHRQAHYLNILAMLSVQYFLTSIGIESELDDVGSPLLNVLTLSDVRIPEIGVLHCQPVLPDAQHLTLSPEVWDDRIGYMAVQFRADLREAEILGFTSSAQASLALNQLNDIEEFLNYLDALESDVMQVGDLNPASETVVHLGEWLTGTITQGWTELKELFEPPQAQLAFRGNRYPLMRGQPVDIGVTLGGPTLAMVISISEETPECIDLKIQIRPRQQEFLPQDLSLQVKDLNTQTLLQGSTARNQDNLIQVNLEANPGDRFRTIIQHDGEEFVQDFCL